MLLFKNEVVMFLYVSYPQNMNPLILDGILSLAGFQGAPAQMGTNMFDPLLTLLVCTSKIAEKADSQSILLFRIRFPKKVVFSICKNLRMKKILFICVIIFFIANSCKKSITSGSSPPPGNPNHELKAMISIKGGTVYSLTATGNNTLYAKRTDPNGELVIDVSGSDSKGQIKFYIINVKLAGTYIIGTASGSPGDSYIIGAFMSGSPLQGPNEIFFVQRPPPPSGTISIDELTVNSIRGSFSMTCVGATGTVEITNGAFKGTF
jgi:hypothetical protein